MFDAHLFALQHGYSRSMPRSTSETYLEKWQPWYLRWIGTSEEPDNVYGRLAKDIARNLELPESGPELMQEVRRRRAALLDRQAALESEKHENETRIEQLHDGIQESLESAYPEVRYPYTRNFMRFLAINLETAQQLIMQHPDYEQLADLQNGQPEIDASVLGAERDTIELDKILRLRKLARLQEQFEAHASDSEQEALQKLMMCETSAF